MLLAKKHFRQLKNFITNKNRKEGLSMIVFFLDNMLRKKRRIMQEILAPVGNWDMLEAALAAGCDAVYLATKDFGARAYAQNFSIEEIKEIVHRCHLVNVKVHVTLNTILYEQEIEKAYQVAYELYKVGVDALIIQDLGLIHLIHHRLPEMVLHASTQMSIHTPEEIERLKKIGVSRVVLARECSKEEIEACKKAGLEIEIFVHGAICISMSGRCYFSSVCYGRSGNRGMCAQPCRMVYELYEDGHRIHADGDYLLSPKDLSLIDRVKELDVDSLKIEGRMKSPAYVYEAVRQVRMVRDGKVRTKKDLKALKQAFNRGYTLGHVYDKKGYELMNIQTSNHQGIVVGKVISSNSKGIRIQLKEDLYQNDGIRIGKEYGCRINYLYDDKHRLQNQITAGKIAEINASHLVKKGDLVRRTISYVQEKEVEKISKETIRKVDVEVHISCKGIGLPLICVADDGVNQVTVQTVEVAQQAKNHALTSNQIEKQMKKTKDSWVEFSKLAYDLNGEIFFPMGILNQLRRNVIHALEEKRCSHKIKEEVPYVYEVESKEIASKIYVNQIEETCAPSTMNVTNSYGVAAIQEMGFERVVLSDEMNEDQILDLLDAYKKRYHHIAPIVVTIYQHRRLMVMRHCPVNTAIKDGQRENCSLCHQHRYSLKGKDGKTYLLKGNKDCFMQIFDENITDFSDFIPRLERNGVNSYLLRFIDEKKEERESVLSAFLD